MAACVSPITVDLTLDSDDGADGDSQTISETCTDQPEDEVYNVDWDDDCGPPGGFDLLDLEYGPSSPDKLNYSISSTETNTNPPEVDDQIIWEDTPEKPKLTQTKTKTNKTTAKQNEKALKEQQKLERQRLREEKKAEALKEKNIKAAAALKHKTLKPEENIKLLRVNIDTKIVTSELGGIVITSLQQAGINYDVGNQIKKNVISWSKKVTDILVSDEGVVNQDVGEKDENQLLYLISFQELIGLVKSNELLTHVQTVKSVYLDRAMTLVITGMQKYLQNKKDENKGKGRGRLISSDEEMMIAKDELEYALVELQLIGKTNHWFVDNGEELASLVITTTKSLSQIDYKKEKRDRDEGDMEWFASSDSKQCVKVDKNGNGLLLLWQRQICQFNTVGMDMANAIASNFNSPQELIRSYRKCSGKSEAELLLQNIQMRRNAGLLSTSRRIGPEVSKKIYNFFMSDDPDLEV